MMFAFHYCPCHNVSSFIIVSFFLDGGYVLKVGGRDIDTRRCEYIVDQSRADTCSQLDCEWILGAVGCGMGEYVEVEGRGG